MNQRLKGIIIRRCRLERNWSQATLCADICAVSYLSRIEQGQVGGSPEVLALLFERLGVVWREEPNFCRESAVWFEDLYDRLFAGENIGDMMPILEQRREEYRYSPFFLDWLLFTWQLTGKRPDGVEEFLPAMDNRQKSLYLCLAGEFEELLLSSDRGYFLQEAGRRALWQGNYGAAVKYLQTGMERAFQEGSLMVILSCCAHLGNCYSCLNQLEQAREYYSRAARMARTLGDAEDVSIISYNLAATEFQLGLTEDALRHLLDHPWNDAMYYHKLAVCYERLGQKKEAYAALEQARLSPMGMAPLEVKTEAPEKIRAFFDQTCQLVRFRLDDPDYLKNPEYGKALCACIRELKKNYATNFARFHARWLLEWYTANRQYQKAYDLLLEISTNHPF
ncbi:MAG: tetratricopeptide repeat protein [Faecousia sp.]